MNRKAILASVLCGMILCGCGRVEQEQTSTVQTDPELTTISEQAETKPDETEPPVTTAKKQEYGKRDIQDARNWLVGDIWNDGIHAVESYAKNGTDTAGQQIDIDFCIDNLVIAYGEKEKYDAVVHALDDSIIEQKQLITAWDKLIEQADMLIEKAKSEKPEPNDENYGFDTDLFFQYMNGFTDACSKVANNKDSDEKGLPVFK